MLLLHTTEDESKDDVSQMLSEIKIFLDLGDLEEAYVLAQKTAVVAKQSNVSNITLFCYYVILDYHTLYSQNRIQTNNTLEKLEEAKRKHDVFSQMKASYVTINRPLVHPRKILGHILEESSNFKEYVQHYNTGFGANNEFIYYLFNSIHLGLIGKHDDRIMLCLQAIKESELTAIKKFTYLSHIAEAQYCLRQWKLCEAYCNEALALKSDANQKNNLLFLKARNSLSQLITCDQIIDEIMPTTIDSSLQIDMLTCMNKLVAGEFDFNIPRSMFDYLNENSGLGITVNVAILWHSILSGNNEIYEEIAESYCISQLKEDKRTYKLIRYLASYNQGNKIKLSKNNFSANVEFIPFDQIASHLENNF